ncbi:MAG TPA: hypothetical protein VI365_31295, partial [Trebonia sp.]
MTLRGRLIAGLVVLLAIGCATVGVTTYMTARDSLLREVSGQLQTATGLWSNCLSAAGITDGHGSRVGVNAAVPSPSVHCYDLGPGTFEAYVDDGKVNATVVDHGDTLLSAADEEALRDLPVTRLPPPGQGDGPPAVYIRRLGSLGESYILTATVDQDGNATCITGLPLGDVDDTLHELAVAELAVFGLVLLLAGVLGTAWVGLSLRPLRRVAAIASQVAELP